jgi:hypothetical protein
MQIAEVMISCELACAASPELVPLNDNSLRS